jgi:hypothetical protein
VVFRYGRDHQSHLSHARTNCTEPVLRSFPDGDPMPQRPRALELTGRVYEITAEGQLELSVQQDATLDVVFGSADPVSVLLLFAAGGDLTDLTERLAERRRRISAQLDSMAAERARLTAQGFLSPHAVAAFRRGELRLEAELRWHDEFEQDKADEAAL